MFNALLQKSSRVHGYLFGYYLVIKTHHSVLHFLCSGERTSSAKFFKLKEGNIMTLRETDRFEQDGYVVHVLPAREYFLNPF